MSSFITYLGKRGFTGKVTIVDPTEPKPGEIVEGNLYVTLSTDEGKSGKVNDVKVLSGGERSYVTLSLLLSLGEASENPFRAMDEFDVFM